MGELFAESPGWSGYPRAVISECERYRFSLCREFGEPGRLMLFCGLNPSKADASRNDNTVAKMIALARRMNCGGLLVGNVLPHRSTEPNAVLGLPRPLEVARANDEALADMAGRADLIVCGWGNHRAAALPCHCGDHTVAEHAALTLTRAHAGRRPLFCLHRNKDGSPGHPLYLPSDSPLVVWQGFRTPDLQPAGQQAMDGATAEVMSK